MYNDKNLTCADCGQEFVFTSSEQDFYSQRGFTEPRRCPSCRASRKAARNSEGGGELVRWLRRRWRVFRRRFRRRIRRRRWRWRLRRPGSRSARDVQRHLLIVRQGSPGPVPPDQRQARLLQRLLPQPARRLIADPLGAGRPTTRRTSVNPDPGCQPTRVVSMSERLRPAGPGSQPCRSVTTSGSRRPVVATLEMDGASQSRIRGRGARRPAFGRAQTCSRLPGTPGRRHWRARAAGQAGAPQLSLERFPPSSPRSNLRSLPWSRRSMLSECASQMNAAPTAA